MQSFVALKEFVTPIDSPNPYFRVSNGHRRLTESTFVDTMVHTSEEAAIVPGVEDRIVFCQKPRQYHSSASYSH